MTKMKLGVEEYIDSAHYLPGHESCGIVHGHTIRWKLSLKEKKSHPGWSLISMT